MDKNIIIVLVSQQTIQNVLFIKEFVKSNDDHILLISTKGMKEKEEWIKNSLNIQNKYHSIIVDEYDNKDILEKLKEFNIHEYKNKYINITGGTKLMSIETYDFFKSIENCHIYYITRGNEYKKIFPIEEENTYNFKCSVSIKEYFKAYGFESKESGLSEIDKEYTYDFLEKFLENDRYHIIQELQRKRGVNNLKKINISEVNGLGKFLSDIGFPLKNEGIISKKEIEYLTGGWFEEYVYYTLKDANIVQDTDILCGVSKKNGQSDNEFDIVILKENQLHIIECKTYICNNDKSSLPLDTIYKLDSIQKELGLFAKPYIITLNKAHEIKESHKKRAGQYGIKILTIENIVEGNLINNIFPNAPQSL